MTAEAHPTFALRPMLATDAPMLAEILRASIEGLTEDYYDSSQQSAWMSVADDEEKFAARLAGQLTLIATMNGAPIGFASLQDTEQVDMLYVHPAVVRQGVASMLMNALEKLAAARGAQRLTTDASDAAVDFFTARGFIPQQRNSVHRGGEWLVNTRMEKQLTQKAATS